MQHGTTFLKRFIALALALVLLVSNANLGVTLQGFAAEENHSHKTVGQIVAENYELSDAEEDLLSSGLLAGNTFEYEVPSEEDELVSIDTKTKKIDADKKGNFNPVKAVIYVDGAEKETVTLTNGEGTYTCTDNAFSVMVTYVYEVAVAEETQNTLLNTAAWLKAGLANLEAIKALDGEMASIASALPELVDFAENGVTANIGGNATEVKVFTDEQKELVIALGEEAEANGGVLNLAVMVAEYGAAIPVQYLLENGQAVKTEVETVLPKISGLNDALTAAANGLDTFVNNGWVDSATALQIRAIAKNCENLFNGLTGVQNSDWTAAQKGTALVATNVNYATLNAKVAAIGETTTVTVKNPLTVATAEVQCNAAMFNVTVKVVLNTVNADNAVTKYGEKTVKLTLNENATKAEIRAAVEASGIVNEALTAWAAVYVDGKFDVAETALPASLTKDIDYTITYTPMNFNVDLAGEALSLPYGYKLTLPKHEDATKAYDYKVNGVSYAQGKVVTIEGETTITRKEGKAYSSFDLYTLAADQFGDELAKEILKSGAVKGSQAINVRKPDPADSGSLLELVNGQLKGVAYEADYNDLSWVPYSYGKTTGDEHKFTGLTADYDGDSAQVKYVLNLTNLDADVAAALALAKTLKSEADAQVSTMNALAAKYDTMGTLDKTKLGALNGVIDVTDFTPDDNNENDAKNLELRAYFKSTVSAIIANNLGSNNKLKIYNMLTDYNNGGLAYYYSNSAAIIAEIDALAGYLGKMMAEEEALKIMVSAAGYPDVAEDIADLETMLANVKAALTAPNAAIDMSNSANYGKLLAALVKVGEVTYTAGTVQLFSDPLPVQDSSMAMIQVVVEVDLAGETHTNSFAIMELEKGTTITKEMINNLNAQIDAWVDGIATNADFYNVTVESDDDLNAYAGKQITADIKIKTEYTYTAKEYTVKIAGEKDQIVSINNLIINLPKHTEEGFHYEYTVDGVSGIQATSYTFTLEQVSKLFKDGTYTITRVEINEADAKFEEVFGDWFVKDASGNPTGDLQANVEASQGGIMDFVMTIVNSGYTYVEVGGEPLMYMNAEDTLEIKLQTLINAILNDDEFTHETLINLGKKGEGQFLSTTMLISMNAPEATNARTTDETRNFTLYLTSVPSQMATIANGLEAAQDYLTFNAGEGKLDINVNLPEPVYAAYLSALLTTGNVDKTDIAAMNDEIAYQFLWDYVETLTDKDVTVQTYENTLAKLGINQDLSAAEEYFEMLKKALNHDDIDINEDKDDEDFKINVCTKSQDAINALINLIGIDISAYETYLGMIYEYKNADAEINVNVDANLDNTGKDYEAIVIDVNGSGMTNKFYVAEDISAKSSKIGGNAFVMLTADVAGNLTFKASDVVVLDLNGKTVGGDITSKGKLIIVDSSLTTKGGVVNGDVMGSGSITVIAGTYPNCDVTGFLMEGYEWKADGTVENSLFRVDGDAKNLTYVINTDVISKNENYIPDVKALAVDIAVDLVLNYYTAAALSVDDAALYHIDIYDLVDLVDSADKVDELIERVLACIDLPGMGDITEMFINDLLDFEAMYNGLSNDAPISEGHEITVAPWYLEVEHVTDGDYMTFGITSNEDLAKSYTVNLALEGDNKNVVLPLLKELAAIAEASVEIELEEPVYNGDTNKLSVEGTSAANLTLKLRREDNAYAQILGVILANGGASQKAAIVDAINNDNMTALKTAVDKCTVTDVFAGLKKLNRADSFATIAKNVGVTVDVAAAAELEELFHLILVAAGKALDELNVPNVNKVLGNLDTDNDGKYEFAEDVTRKTDASARGYTVYTNAKATVTLVVELFNVAEGEHVHSYEAVVTAPTCTEDGYTTYTCSCGDSYVVAGDPALGHDYVEVVTAPSCTDDGYTTYTCSRCGHSYTEAGEPATGHTYASVVTVPTCTAKGYTTYTCSVCGDTYVDDYVDALGHKYDEVVTAPTCTAKGYTTYTCSVCGHSYVGDETAALGHTEETIPGKDATCTETGLTEGTICSVCGEVLVAQEEIPALGHTEEVIPGYEATCSEDGLTDGVICSVCGEVLVPQEVIPATGEHVDENHNHICDICWNRISDCYDIDPEDGYCDYCGRYICDCETDADKDHHCDVCGRRISWCFDCNRDHKCDVCGETISTCIDMNHNHICDICWKTLSECVDKDNDHFCDYCLIRLSFCEDKNKDHFCDVCGLELSKCTDDNRDGICDICGVELDWVIRLYGDNRAATARDAAEELKAIQGVEKFDAIVYASGYDFPDALAGTYFANVKDAPILMYFAGEIAMNQKYIVENLSANGVVYILGGTNAVPASVETALVEAGIKVVRLGGETRFETNLEILDETGFKGGETVLVCTGYEFADSLSASATGMPILLVNNSFTELRESQVEYLEGLSKDCNFILIGGTNAISTELEVALTAYDADGKVERIGGATRFETSLMVAEKFFPNATQAILAYGWMFPDALCGGTIGYALNAPVILATDAKIDAVNAFLAKRDITSGYVMGGSVRLTDEVVCNAFGLESADQIHTR